MEKSLTKKNETIGKTVFRKHLKISMLGQILYLMVAFMAIKFFPPAVFGGHLVFFGLLFGLNVILCFFTFHLGHWQGRFRDIYPEHELSTTFLVIAIFVPALFLVLTFVLWMKDGQAKEAPSPFLYKKGYALLGIIPILAIQIASPKTAFWTATPSTFHVINVAHEVSAIFTFRKSASIDSSIFKQYQQKHPGKLQATELTLLTAVAASSIMKEKKRNIASEKAKFQEFFSYAMKLLIHSHEALALSEASLLEFADFSLAQWLYPTGPVEVILLSLVEAQASEELRLALIKKTDSLMSNIEKKLAELPEAERAPYTAQLKMMRQKFSETDTSRSIARSKASI